MLGLLAGLTLLIPVCSASAGMPGRFLGYAANRPVLLPNLPSLSPLPPPPSFTLTTSFAASSRKVKLSKGQKAKGMEVPG